MGAVAAPQQLQLPAAAPADEVASIQGAGCCAAEHHGSIPPTYPHPTHPHPLHILTTPDPHRFTLQPLQRHPAADRGHGLHHLPLFGALRQLLLGEKSGLRAAAAGHREQQLNGN